MSKDTTLDLKGEGRIKLTRNLEMSAIYKALKGIDEQEVEEALAKKNTLREEHIFDILNARGVILYNHIWLKLQEITAEHIESEKIIYALDSSSLFKEDGKVYLLQMESGQNVRVEVNVGYLPTVKLIEDSKPLVILPKNEFNIFISKRIDEHRQSDASLRFSFADMVADALNKRVSDIHILFSSQYYFVGFRIDGEYINQPQYLMNKLDGELFIKKIKQEAVNFTRGSFQADEHDLPQGARIELRQLNTDIRLQFTPKGVLSGENTVTARILLKKEITDKSVDFIKDGYDEDFVELMQRSSHLRGGMFFIVGITGSGKSTLLSNYLVTLPLQKRIISVEDPIEYDLIRSNTSQHQLLDTGNSATSITPLDYVRAAKRSDPDVFSLGETRKDEGNVLINALIEAGKAGQLVTSTIHIGTVFDVYRTLIDVFGLDEKTVAGNILLLVNQVLVKKLCPVCKIEDTEGLNKKRLKQRLDERSIMSNYTEPLEEFLEEDSNTKTYIRNHAGCEHCRKHGLGDGTAGRMPIYEYLKPDVKFISWVKESSKDFDRFTIEREACLQKNKFLAKNKLTVFVEALKSGKIDAYSDVLDNALS